MSIDTIIQNNVRLREIKEEVSTGDIDNVPEAHRLDDLNYRAYFSELHKYLAKEFGTESYSASYFGANDDFKVAESMPTKWLYFDKSEKYKSKEVSKNIKFEYADLTEGLPRSINPESLDFILVKKIYYEFEHAIDLVDEFPIYEGLKKGGVIASDHPILDNEDRYEKLEFHDDLNLESFGDRVAKKQEVYWNMEKLHLYRKI